MLMDGFPTGGYIFGIIAEFVLGSYSIFQLKNTVRTNIVKSQHVATRNGWALAQFKILEKSLFFEKSALISPTLAYLRDDLISE
jgi:hypothetical protein